MLAPERRTLEDVVLEATECGLGPGGAAVIAVELRKMLRSRRTWVTIAVIDALPSLVAVLLAVTDLGPRPGTGPAFLSAVLADGALYPLAAIAIILPLFLPAAVAITAGETIAGEAQQGTLRYVLIRPVGRTRLLVAKLVAVMGFVLVTLLVVAATAYLLGVLLLGDQTSTVTTTFSGTSLTTPQLIERTGLALAYALLSMLGVAAVALFLSTVVRSPLAAAMGTLALLIGSSLLLTLDAAHGLRPYLRHPLLAVVRRPVPRPDPVARRRPRGAPPGGVRRGVPRRRLGQLRHQGHHRLRAVLGVSRPTRTEAGGAAGGVRRSSASTIAITPGRSAAGRESPAAPGHTDCTEKSSAPSREAVSGGVETRSSVVQIETQARSLRASRPRR